MDQGALCHAIIRCGVLRVTVKYGAEVELEQQTVLNLVERKLWTHFPVLGTVLRRLGQALAGGVDRRLGAVGGAGFVEDVADMTAHGPGANKQLLGNLPIGLTGNDEAEHLHLTVGQAGRIRRGFGWLRCGSLLEHIKHVDTTAQNILIKTSWLKGTLLKVKARAVPGNIKTFLNQ